MPLLASILLFSLTRAELIDRMRAEPVTQLQGMVRVYGDCPSDMRKEFQLPIASFVSAVCGRLYTAEGMRPLRFAEPAIVVRIGDVRTNVSDVAVRPGRRDDGSAYTRIRLPAPAHSDLETLRRETVKAFYRAVKGEELDDAEAERRFRGTDPLSRAEDIAGDVARWREGVYSGGRDDEDYLELLRGVHLPGAALRDEILTFASRLYLYPLAYDSPFCGKYTAVGFRDAVACAKTDPAVRYAAYLKASAVVLYGGGRGEELAEAADAYSKFLFELARLKLDDEELYRMLDDADAKLGKAAEAE